MSTQATPSVVEIEALRKAYAAFNRNDIAATVEALDPQIKSNGLSRPSFREARRIMATKESWRTFRKSLTPCQFIKGRNHYTRMFSSRQSASDVLHN